MRIIFTGSGEFGLPTLRALLKAGHEVVAVYTQPDRPAGRGRKLTATPIGEFARGESLACVATGNLNAEKFPECDLMVVIAFGQKISPAAAAHGRLGSVNLHASRLPKYRGAAPINWAILSGESVTGNSIIRLATRMDAGAVLGQSSVEIGPVETAGELHDRLALDGAELMLRVVGDLEAGCAVETPQDESLATQAPKLTRKLAQIDWNFNAQQISTKIRGMFPWPGCRAALTDAAGTEIARLTLVRARAAEGEGPRWEAGEVMTDGLVCAAGGAEAVELLEIQPAGKRPMSLADYRRGHGWMAGMRLRSLDEKSE
jgi:methionyl-tRNA formyltransferase